MAHHSRARGTGRYIRVAVTQVAGGRLSRGHVVMRLTCCDMSTPIGRRQARAFDGRARPERSARHLGDYRAPWRRARPLVSPLEASRRWRASCHRTRSAAAAREHEDSGVIAAASSRPD